MRAQSHLRSAREAKGLSLKSAADLIGVSPISQRRYEYPPGHKHQRVPAPEIMARIWVVFEGRVRPDHFYALPELEAAE